MVDKNHSHFEGTTQNIMACHLGVGKIFFSYTEQPIFFSFLTMKHSLVTCITELIFSFEFILGFWSQ